VSGPIRKSPRRRAAAEGEAERYEAERDGPDLAYEHAHRYALAATALSGLRVLDLASGSGYGTAVLRAAGANVVPFDLDATAAARQVGAVRGDAMRLPFRDASFEAIVCFEAIEHVSDPEAVAREAARLLHGPSILIVSTPDREIYTKRAQHKNPHHVSEMSQPEFRALLRRHFTTVTLFGQSLWAGSWMARLGRGGETRGLGKHSVVALSDPTRHTGVVREPARWSDPSRDELPVPVYLIAACANTDEGRARLRAALPAESVLHDSHQWYVGQYERATEELGGRHSELEEQLVRARADNTDQAERLVVAREALGDYEQRIAVTRKRFGELEAELARARESTDALERELGEAQLAARRRDEEFDELRAGLQDRDEQLSRARGSADTLESQLEQARLNSRNSQRQLEDARHGTTVLEEEIRAAQHSSADFTNQLGAARIAANATESELSAARASAADLEAQICAAENTANAHEAELVAARESATDLEGQIRAARATATAREDELAAASASAADLEGQIRAAYEVGLARETELAEAKGTLATVEARLQETSGALRHYEQQSARRLVRVSIRLADQVDRALGRNPTSGSDGDTNAPADHGSDDGSGGDRGA
jgi:SAM-dependent methyltransferase